MAKPRRKLKRATLVAQATARASRETCAWIGRDGSTCGAKPRPGGWYCIDHTYKAPKATQAPVDTEGDRE